MTPTMVVSVVLGIVLAALVVWGIEP